MLSATAGPGGVRAGRDTRKLRPGGGTWLWRASRWAGRGVRGHPGTTDPRQVTCGPNLDRGKGESWGWGLRLLEAPSSGGETWISHEVGSGGKASWRGTPWRDRDTRNFGNRVVRAEVVEEIQAESSRNRSWLGVTGS